VKLLTAPPEKTAYKPWPERAQEESQSKESSCWSEELTKATPKSQLGKKLDKIALAVNYELSKKSRGGDGSTFAPIEGTPPWIKPLDSNAKASLPQKQAAGNANLMNLPTTGKLQLESQESSSSPSSRSSSSESFSNNSSSTEKRDNTVTTLSLTDPEQFPPLAASSQKDVTPGNKLSDKVPQSTLVINVSKQPEMQGEKKGDKAESAIGDNLPSINEKSVQDEQNKMEKTLSPKQTNKTLTVSASTMEIDEEPTPQSQNTELSRETPVALEEQGILPCAPHPSGQTRYNPFFTGSPKLMHLNSLRNT
jgi:hypothetical protein